MNRIYHEILNEFDINESHISLQKSNLLNPSSSNVSEKENTIIISEDYIKSGHLKSFYQNLYQFFTYYHNRNILIYFLSQSNLKIFFGFIKKLDMIKYNVSYWNKELTISNRQKIIVDWFQFHSSLFDFTKNFFLTYLSYKKFIKIKLEEVFTVLFNLILKLSQNEIKDDLNKITEEEGDYEHADLLVHFFGQFLGHVMVYEFNKMCKLDKNNVKILSVNDILSFFQNYKIFSFKDKEIILTNFKITEQLQKIKTSTNNFFDEYNNNLKFQNKKSNLTKVRSKNN
jgi:hypothetical protein